MYPEALGTVIFALALCSQGPQEFSWVLVLSVVKYDNLTEVGASVVAELDMVPQPHWLPVCLQAGEQNPIQNSTTCLLITSSL